mgnify:CR=1
MSAVQDGYQDKSTAVKFNVTVKDCSAVERRARILELQEKVLKTPAVIDTEAD